MIALPGKFRIKMFNATGVTLTTIGDVFVRAVFQKFSASGEVVESSETGLYASSASLANNTYDTGGWIDNTSTKWVAFHGHVVATVSGSPSGTLKFYLENATNVGTPVGPSDGRGWMLIEIPFTAAGTTTRPIKT